MNTLKVYFTLALSLIAILGFGQGVDSNWKQNLSKSVEGFKACVQTVEDGVNPCSKFTGEAVKTVYKVNDFYSQSLGRYMTGTEIVEHLNSGNKWKLLGYAYDQKVLTEAQTYANAKKAVVAVYLSDEKQGHVSIILPGELTKSGSWGFDVPNSASFFMNSPQKSYVDKGLSYAFGRNFIRKVQIFGRNY